MSMYCTCVCGQPSCRAASEAKSPLALMQVFGPSALAAAGVVPSTPGPRPEVAELSSGTQQAQHSLLAQQAQQAEQQVSMRRPLVPRLQLSSISLQQLQAQASPTPQGPVAAVPPACGLQAEALAAGEAAVGSAHLAHGRQQSGDSFAHVMLAADGTPALGSLPAGLALQRPLPHTAAATQQGVAAFAEATPSPASSVQQSSAFGAPPLTARRAVSPAQQELLATARQWQRSARAAAVETEAAEDLPHPGYPPPLPSARGSCRGPAPPSLFAHGGAAAVAPQGAAAAPRSHHPQRAAAAGATPRRAAAAPGSVGAFPGTPGRKLAAAKGTYGQDPTFQEIRAAYNAGGRAAGLERARYGW